MAVGQSWKILLLAVLFTSIPIIKSEASEEEEGEEEEDEGEAEGEVLSEPVFIILTFALVCAILVCLVGLWIYGKKKNDRGS